MREIKLDDPIKFTLKNIIELTSSMVNFLRRAGRKEEAKQLILYVATCLYNILIRKQERYQQTLSHQSGLEEDIMLKGQKQLTNKALKGEVREKPIYNQAKSLEIIHKISNLSSPEAKYLHGKRVGLSRFNFPPEEFKTGYLEPLKRAVDNFLSTAVYWKELNLITEGELAETQSLWQRVALYIKKQ